MILQCDQCNTRFRLDDSKLKPGGVKVRCSKCRHVFLAGAEQKHEESEFDAILSGLGAPVPEKQQEEAAPVRQEAAEFGFDEESAPEPEAPVPAASQPEISDFTAFDFPAEPSEPQEKPAPVPEERPDFGAFDFAPEATLQREAQPTTASQGLDYGEFAFADEPPALKEEPGPAPDESFDFGEFPFAAEPAAEMEEMAPAAPGGGLDFGDFDFNAEPVVKPQEPPAAPDELDFGEFSFPEEPAVINEEPLPADKEAFDFGEFSFPEEPAVINEEPPPADKEAFDFGEFSFAEEPAVMNEEPPPAAKEALDFGEFSFAEEPAVMNEEPLSAAKETPDFGDFSFPEEPPLTKKTPTADASDGFGSFPLSDELQQKEGEAAAPVPSDAFSLGEFPFSQDFAGKEAQATAEPAGAAGLAAAAGLVGAAGAAASAAAKRPEPAAPPVFPATDTEKPSVQEAALDFGFGANEEELPPLSISSRRKGRSLLTIFIVAVSVLVILALSGAGLYLLQSGPVALEKFDKLGLGFVAKWFGMESPEEGRITIRNPLAAFHQNKEAGEIFVVTGEAVNSFRKARASIHVKVSLFDKNGAVLLQKTAYCGNKLSTEQLATLPMAKIESIMNNQFGDSLSNLGVKPGQTIGFVVAIANVPKEAVDFGVDVVGSTVAGQ
jgi:predicted Zn finger-like uncharacterized protein